MRAVVQRVVEAAVVVGGGQAGRIGKGLLVFLGVGHDDTLDDVRYLSDKVAHLRIFADDSDKMNRSVIEAAGEVLVVSQFTLFGDCRKGRRPSYTAAAPPDPARALYEAFAQALRDCSIPVATGRFQETMQVRLVNDGPVTLLLDSKKVF
jgi:D-tyrosyl-tRNA(Tyr) deacylase